MAWIESHQSLGGHLKLRRLARELRIHRAQAIGHLHFLWWWALDNAPTGCLSALASTEIAELSEWPGPEDVFVDALKRCGWLNDDLSIHDWEEYAGKMVLAREKDRQRKRDERATERERLSKDVQKTSLGQAKDVCMESAHTQPNPTVPNPTVPNPTVPNPRKRFIRPTIEEVKLQMAKTGLPESQAQEFIDYHEARGWMLGKSEMRSWTAAVGTWKANYHKFNGHGHNTTNGRPSVSDERNRWIGDATYIEQDIPI